MLRSLVGSEMCIRDSINAEYGDQAAQSMPKRKLDDRLQEGCQVILTLCGIEGAEESQVLNKLIQDGFSTEEIQEVTNHLLTSGAVNIFNNTATGQKLLKRQTLDQQAQAKMLAGLGDEELLVLQRVKEAGVNGVWKKTLKIETGLKQSAKFEKALKNLQSKALIKRVCTKNGPKAQTYMLAELDPPESVTGWPWHAEDGMLNVDFINKLRECIIQLVAHKQRATLGDMHKHVTVSGIDHSAELSQQHVSCILEVLMNDNKVETVPSELATGSGQMYRPARLNTDSIGEGVMAMPCGVCPVAKQCKVGGLISPTSCEYLDKWLDF
eukprot:TRINITY_DN5592_c0_g1_i2.p1 TRINITY_DN5592_c0_g1~~TRINITY_DN5592_c0_g1_i2.p1  ORF type:complete len:325 (-),score=107.02 TRINITY_DN5592_c0_g1_i2:370-1344(-)